MLSLLRGAGLRMEDDRFGRSWTEFSVAPGVVFGLANDELDDRLKRCSPGGRGGSDRCLRGEVCTEGLRSGEGALSNTNVGIDSKALDNREPFGGRAGKPLFGLGDDGSPSLTDGGRMPESLARAPTLRGSDGVFIDPLEESTPLGNTSR